MTTSHHHTEGEARSAIIRGHQKFQARNRSAGRISPEAHAELQRKRDETQRTQEAHLRRAEVAHGTRQVNPSSGDISQATEEWKRDNPGKKLAGHEREVNRRAQDIAERKYGDTGHTGNTPEQTAAERQRVKDTMAREETFKSDTAKRLAAEKAGPPSVLSGRHGDYNAMAAFGKMTPEQRARLAEAIGEHNAKRVEEHTNAFPVGTHVQTNVGGHHGVVVGHSPAGAKVQFDSGRTAHLTGNNMRKVEAPKTEAPKGPSEAEHKKALDDAYAGLTKQATERAGKPPPETPAEPSATERARLAKAPETPDTTVAALRRRDQIAGMSDAELNDVAQRASNVQTLRFVHDEQTKRGLPTTAMDRIRENRPDIAEKVDAGHYRSAATPNTPGFKTQGARNRAGLGGESITNRVNQGKASAPGPGAERQMKARQFVETSGIKNWEQTKPWDRSASDFEAGRVPGFNLDPHAARGYSARWQDDHINLNRSVFDGSTPESRRSLFYHEAGHGVAGEVSTTHKDLAPLLAPFKHGNHYVSPFGGVQGEHGHADEPSEILADAYAALMDGTAGRYTGPGTDELFKTTQEAARTLGYPTGDRNAKPGPPTHEDWRQQGADTFVKRPGGDMVQVRQAGPRQFRWSVFTQDGRSAQGTTAGKGTAQKAADAAHARLAVAS